MRINQNIAAFNAYRNLNVTSGQQAKSLEKLSSGFRINRAADDAAGLVNSENLRAQIGGLQVATRNAQDAISLVQTAEGAQTEVHSILQRMRDLTVQTGNTGTNDEAAVTANQAEIDQLKEELTRIASQTQFGTKQILDGTDGTNRTLSLTFQVGANSGQTVSVDINAVRATDLDNIETVTNPDGTTTTTGQTVNDINFTGKTGADLDAAVSDALDTLDAAISSVSANRADLGAFQNRMESTIRNVSVATENLQAAESRIRDTDMAAEMVSFTRSQIMQQAGTAMLAQANQVPQSVLSLLR
jgi:flagellin